MRTKCQQSLNDTESEDHAMFKELKELLSRPQATLAQDAIGLTALVVILFVGLHLPLIA